MAKETTEAQRWMIEAFGRFIAELHRERRRVENAVAQGAPSGRTASGEGVGFAAVQRELKTLLEDLAVEATGTMRPETFARAQYAMTVLADEIFVKHMADWEGAQDWQEHPLEVELFGSQDAATLFFTHADRVIESADRADAPVAEIFYYALALGFEGMLDPQERAEYLRKLAVRFGRTARRPREVAKLCPETYRNLHVDSTGGFLPTAWKAIAVVAAVAVLSIVGVAVTYGVRTGTAAETCNEIQALCDDAQMGAAMQTPGGAAGSGARRAEGSGPAPETQR